MAAAVDEEHRAALRLPQSADHSSHRGPQDALEEQAARAPQGSLPRRLLLRLLREREDAAAAAAAAERRIDFLAEQEPEPGTGAGRGERRQESPLDGPEGSDLPAGSVSHRKRLREADEELKLLREQVRRLERERRRGEAGARTPGQKREAALSKARREAEAARGKAREADRRAKQAEEEAERRVREARAQAERARVALRKRDSDLRARLAAAEAKEVEALEAKEAAEAELAEAQAALRDLNLKRGQRGGQQQQEQGEQEQGGEMPFHSAGHDEDVEGDGSAVGDDDVTASTDSAAVPGAAGSGQDSTVHGGRAGVSSGGAHASSMRNQEEGAREDAAQT